MRNILLEDLEYIALTELPWDNLFNSTILVTGATGLIGSLMVKALHTISKTHLLNIKVIIWVRDSAKAIEIFGDIPNIIIESDIKSTIFVGGKVDYIIHCAAVTKSKEMISDPVGNIKTLMYGTDNILELARKKKIKSLVYLSSMEVYGVFDSFQEKVTEEMLGYLDLSNPRSSYPEGKRICECLCHSYFEQYEVPVKVARLAQTFGAGISKDENRVFAQFAKCVMNKKNIVLHTDGSSLGNFCYSADVIKGILYILLKGQNNETYNIANEDMSMTIRDMANIVANKISGGEIEVIMDIPQNNIYGYAPRSNMKLSAVKMTKLGWQPSFGMEEMYRRMIQYIQE